MDPFYIVILLILVLGVLLATFTFMSTDRVGFMTAFRRLVGLDRSE